MVTYTLFLICRNNSLILKRSLPIILSSTRADHIIAFDSESEDETVNILKQSGIRVINIPKEQFGHGRTRNLSLRYSYSEIFVFLNGDAIPADGWFTNLINSARDYDAAFSRQIPDENCDPLRITDLLHHPYFKSDTEIIIDSKSRERIMFDTVSCAIKREVLNRYNFPDVPFGEDLIWARQIVSKGGRIIYVPESMVVHSHSLYRDFSSIVKRHFEEGRLSSTAGEKIDIDYILRFLPSAFVLDAITLYFLNNLSDFEKLFWLIKEPLLRYLQLLSFIAGLNHDRIHDILKKRLQWER